MKKSISARQIFMVKRKMKMSDNNAHFKRPLDAAASPVDGSIFMQFLIDTFIFSDVLFNCIIARLRCLHAIMMQAIKNEKEIFS